MIRKHQIVQLTSYSSNRPYQASYQVVRGRKVANMVSNWPHQITSLYHGWVFELRQLAPVDAIDFRLTSDVGVWEGRIPRKDMPSAYVSFASTFQGELKMTGKYAGYFRKVA